MSNDNFITLVLQLMAGLGAVVVALFSFALARVWGEIGKLRSVRHEDRDFITQNNSKLQIIQFEIEDLKKEIRSRYRRMKELIEKNKKRS